MANLYTSQTPTIPNIFENQNVTVGQTLVFAVAGTVDGGRFFAPTTVGAGMFELTLWEITADDNPAASGTGTLLASASFGALTPGAWNSVSFSAPVAITPLTKAYRLAVRTSEGRYAATGAFFNSAALVNGDITGPQTGTDPVGIGPLDDGNFIESITTYPNKTFNGNAYFVDPNFTPAGAPIVYTDTSGGAAGAGSADTLSRVFVDTSGGAAGAGSSDTLSRTFVDGSGGSAGAGSADTLARVFVDTSGGAAGAGSGDALSRVFVDSSGGAAGAGSGDALTRGLVFTDTSGGAVGAGSADTLPTDRIYTDSSGGAAGAGSPDPSVTPTLKQDTMVMPILTQALQCLRDQTAVAPAPPAYYHVRPGADFEQQADQYGDECCAGIAWTRMAANYEGDDDSWLEPNARPTNCPPISWAVVIELGIMRCIPLAADRRGGRVTDAQWTAAAQQQMDDTATLRRVLCCLREAFDMADVAAGQIGPLPNSGGCGGVTMQVTIRAAACDTCT